MTTLTPDKLQALQALIQQGAPPGQEEVSLSVPVQITNSAINLDNLTRLLVLEGTAITAKLDEILFRTAQGEVQLKIQQPKDQGLYQLLPARVSLQLRPGPNGLEAMLVMGSRASNQGGALDITAPLASSTQANTHTLATEIPNIGKVFSVTVLPQSLLSEFSKGNPQTQFMGQTAGQTPSQLSPAPQTMAKPTEGPSLINAFLARLGIHLEAAQHYEAGKTAILSQPYVAPSALPQSIVQAAAHGPLATTIKILQVIYPGDALKQQQGAGITPVPQPQSQAQPLAASQPSEDNTVLAVVRGSSPSGQQILAVEDAILAVRTGKAWPPGTQLKIAIGPGANLVVAQDMPESRAGSWESLKQVLEAMGAANPNLMKEVLQSRVPQVSAPQHLSGALLFFMSALKNGELSSWLGNDTVQQLERMGRLELVRQLQEDWQARHTLAYDAQGSEWHGTHVPFLEQDKVKHFAFYVHEDKSKKSKEGHPEAWARRFLIDVQLTRLGPIQIDGLVHTKKLDLMVRTDTSLPEELRQELRTVFSSCMEEIRYVGTLTFHQGRGARIDFKQPAQAKIEKEI